MLPSVPIIKFTVSNLLVNHESMGKFHTQIADSIQT